MMKSRTETIPPPVEVMRGELRPATARFPCLCNILSSSCGSVGACMALFVVCARWSENQPRVLRATMVSMYAFRTSKGTCRGETHKSRRPARERRTRAKICDVI